MPKKKEIKTDKNIKIFTIAILLVVILSILLMIIIKDKDYTEVKLRNNDRKIFTIDDLSVGKLRFGMSEKDIEKELGKANKKKEETRNSYKYKKLSYDGLTLMLRENYDDYILVGAQITKSKYSIGRKIKVNDSIVKTMKKFKVENERGNYIYGNYSVNALNESEIKENIYLGLRDKKIVSYINRDAIIEGSNTNIAKLDFIYKKGKIIKIVWSYDFE